MTRLVNIPRSLGRPLLSWRRWLQRAAVGALVLLHAVLLGRRVVSGTLFEPGVILHWVVGLALCAAFWQLQRRGVSLVTGRPAMVVWLLVLLLHVSVPAALPAAGSATALLVMPVAPAVFFGLLLALWTIAAGSLRLPTPRRAVRGELPRGLSPGHFAPLFGRPPPAL